MGGKTQEELPAERAIYLSCHLQISKDVTLILIRTYGDEPEKIPLKKGTSVTLIEDRQLFCATDKGCGNGPLVRIEETRGIDVPDRYIKKLVVVPARFLKLHPSVL
jgi:hypothetical protein